MVIALAGYKGFIGSHIRKELQEHEFILLDRRDLLGAAIDLAKIISGADVIINVAGYDISARWTKANRQKIYFSRVNVSANIAEAIKLCEERPGMFINASAIGIYENGKTHTEAQYSTENDFLADVVKDWENAAENAREYTKLTLVRMGMVLGNDGGAFPRLYKLTRCGLGAVLGSGAQMVSFIHVKDIANGLRFLMEHQKEGIFNLTAPHPVSNRNFTKTIAKHARRRAIFRIPAFAMKMIMGQAAEIVLKGQTVYPKRLQEAGYKFNFATIDQAIENLVKQK